MKRPSLFVLAVLISLFGLQLPAVVGQSGAHGGGGHSGGGGYSGGGSGYSGGGGTGGYYYSHRVDPCDSEVCTILSVVIISLVVMCVCCSLVARGGGQRHVDEQMKANFEAGKAKMRMNLLAEGWHQKSDDERHRDFLDCDLHIVTICRLQPNDLVSPVFGCVEVKCVLTLAFVSSTKSDKGRMDLNITFVPAAPKKATPTATLPASGPECNCGGTSSEVEAEEFRGCGTAAAVANVPEVVLPSDIAWDFKVKNPEGDYLDDFGRFRITKVELENDLVFEGNRIRSMEFTLTKTYTDGLMHSVDYRILMFRKTTSTGDRVEVCGRWVVNDPAAGNFGVAVGILHVSNGSFVPAGVPYPQPMALPFRVRVV